MILVLSSTVARKKITSNVAATIRGTLSPLSAPTSMSVDPRADRGGQANMSVVSFPSTLPTILMGSWDVEGWSVSNGCWTRGSSFIVNRITIVVHVFSFLYLLQNFNNAFKVLYICLLKFK